MSRPRLYFDHALIAVPDLDASVRAFEARHGLTAYPGGRHPGVGTANAIVPLGGDQYLELITVVNREEAQREPLRSRVVKALDAGELFAGWALRSDDIDALAPAVEVVARAEGARDRPDGVRLAWRTAAPRGADSGSAVPFFIQWTSGEHPGRSGERRAVRRVVAQAPSGVLDWLTNQVELDVDVQVVEGASARLLALELEGLTVS